MMTASQRPVPAVLTAATDKRCSAGLTLAPWQFDRTLHYGPGASEHDRAAGVMARQPALPALYRNATLHMLQERITQARRALGERLLVLGHFYQRDEVVQHADFVGDSYQLARAATQRSQAKFIVFCGVHFMAETADILSDASQQVLLPHLGAGCSMADMADAASVETCWRELATVWGKASVGADARAPIIPVTYMNSAAVLKAFCGRNGGIVCTSSNAHRVIQWALERGQRVLFFPDEHLGRNTAHALGIAPAQMAVWDPACPLGGATVEQLRQSVIVLWKGYCSVHQRFTCAQIEAARARDPRVRVLVHLECSHEVVAAADAAGSTDLIRREVEAAPAGSAFAIGTEINMVNRLAHQHPQLKITCLDPVVCPCSTMYRIHPAYLAWILDGLREGAVHNRIRVQESIATDARVALTRMLDAQP